MRYLANARNMLREAPREGMSYADVKPVREACGTAYLAVLKAIDEYLLEKGLAPGKKALPKSIEGYRGVLHKHLSIRNGRLCREFENLYDELHIAGYYRGLLHNINIVRDVLKAAENFIQRLG